MEQEALDAMKIKLLEIKVMQLEEQGVKLRHELKAERKKTYDFNRIKDERDELLYKLQG